MDDVDRLPLRLALGVGLFQVLAILFPGLSRSGATIMGGMVLGLSRVASTEFSFFLAIPAMMGASIIKLYGVRDLLTPADAPMFAVGFLTAFVSALIVIRALIAYVSGNDFRPFAGTESSSACCCSCSTPSPEEDGEPATRRLKGSGRLRRGPCRSPRHPHRIL